MTKPSSIQPAHRFLVDRNNPGMQRTRWKLYGTSQDGKGAPRNEHHHHDRGDDHDLQGLLAGLVDALGVLPPEINNHKRRENGCEVILGKMNWASQVGRSLLQESPEILTGRHRADGTSENVVEQQGRDRELGQRSAHGFLYHPVHAATHEHAAGLDIQSTNRVAEQHHGQDEPRSTLADDLLGVTTRVISGGGEVGKHNSGRAPERNERQHYCRGDEYLYGGPLDSFPPNWQSRT